MEYKTQERPVAKLQGTWFQTSFSGTNLTLTSKLYLNDIDNQTTL